MSEPIVIHLRLSEFDDSLSLGHTIVTLCDLGYDVVIDAQPWTPPLINTPYISPPYTYPYVSNQ